MQGICQEAIQEAEFQPVRVNRFGKIIKKVLSVLATVLAVLLGALAMLICRSVSWALNTWSDLSIEEIVYHLKMPLDGTNSDMITDYIVSCVVISAVIAAALIVTFIFIRKRRKAYHVTRAATLGVAVLAGALAIHHFWVTLDISAYVENQSTYSSFIDDNYVNPASVSLTFPEQKRNLIYIFLESMENTYADQENGGAFEKNVIPELTALSEENENFSGDQAVLNGGHVLTGATWTIGAMFAQTSGLPLSIPIDKNSMSTQEEFFPGLTTLGDILEDQGYRQCLLIGSDAAFGGRDLYFEQHGNYEIADYNYSLETGEIPSDYYVWWGYEDKILFENAKNRLNELAAEDEPFNLTLLTVDTHFEDGYVCSECLDTFRDDQYSNVIACSSKQVAEFVEWVQEQPFYENTTIVISGDHLTMDSDYCNDVAEDYERKVYTTYINSAVETESGTYREYSTFDAFPTTLASLGVEIPGNQLGLGTNLFSDEETLVERYGVDETTAGLAQKSMLMEELLSKINEELIQIIVDPYDSETKTVTVRLNDVHLGEEMHGLQCGVWADPDQQDIVWYEPEEVSEGNYIVVIPFEDFGYKNGTYNLHVYAKMNENSKSSVFFGGTTLEIQDNIVVEDSDKPEENLPIASAEITVEPYDYRTGKFDVYVGNIQNVDDVVSVQCAVWAEEDQSDLWWYEGEYYDDDTYVVHVYASDFQFVETTYNIHIYVTDSTGFSIFVGSSVGEIT